jgi:transposase-like protein
VELSRNRFTNQEAFVSHANAALTPRARLRLARLVVESGWTYAAAAKMFMVAPRTAKKWADRFRAEGPAGMADRSSRPHVSPTKDQPAGDAANREVAVAQAAGPGPDSRPTWHGGLDRARGADPVPAACEMADFWRFNVGFARHGTLTF